MKKQNGFTLVEIAIVIVIIGLLIGGVMKGQELLRTTQMNSLITDMTGIDTAFTQFWNKYNAIPGDILNPSGILPNCTAGACADGGDANLQIMDSNAAESAIPPAHTEEKFSAFHHLQAAGLITGIKSQLMSFGEGMPAAAIGGGYWLGHDLGTATTTVPVDHRSGTYISYGESRTTTNGEHMGGMLGAEVGAIDRKIDDGTPYTGRIVNHGDPANCVTGGTAYVENSTVTNCSIAMKTTTR
ncbi:MAG: prepilin-type N-terminal cleavage/methylation domain-containing protein [Alphaproteobacteria bacterium]|nr:prepilin-type N-terminal cleavage/methylation domain-containing protein [Alphaproteobacteria bacterium]